MKEQEFLKHIQSLLAIINQEALNRNEITSILSDRLLKAEEEIKQLKKTLEQK